MNEITLRGIIHNIEFSHKIKNTEFYKAIVEVENPNGGEPNFITVKYKQSYCNYGEGDAVALKGNIRSYSYKEGEKNKVNIYVFTYFDEPENDSINEFRVNGRVCKVNPLYTTKAGNYSLQFILANNLYDESRGLKFNSYLPVVCWGEEALRLSKELNVNDEVQVVGSFHTRHYTKAVNNEEVVFEVQELIAESVNKDK